MIDIARFFLSWTIMFGIATGFVCLGQELSVYHSLSWTIWVIYSRLCLSWANRLIYQPVLSVMDKIGRYFTQFCLSWTRLVGISASFVCHGKHWLVYRRVLSVMDNIIWYTSLFCLS